MLAHGIPHDWPEETLAEARAWPSEVPERAKAGPRGLAQRAARHDRRRRREATSTTPCTASRNGDGWRLLVAIADVSHYVQPDTPLDREARRAARPCTFPDRVVPMLPEELSNGLCSLNPHVDRLCLVCEMHVSANGEVTRSRFYDGVMRSQRGSPTQEAAGCSSRRGRAASTPALKPALAASATPSTRRCARARERRGAIDFDLTETKIELDERGKVDSVRAGRAARDAQDHRRMHDRGERRVREAHATRRSIPGLYRVHEGPDEESSRSSCCSCGRSVTSCARRARSTPKEINRILDERVRQARGRARRDRVLRSLKQARYQPENVGHFGLALEAYAHFTSPIRRYPGSARASRHQVAQRQALGRRGSAMASTEMEQLGEHCSRTERRADEATRDVAERLKCFYLEGARRRDVRRRHQQRGAVRVVRALGGDSSRRPRARDRAAARLLPPGSDGHGAERRALGARVPAHRHAEGTARRRQRRRAQDRLRARRERPAGAGSRSAAAAARG